MIIRTSPHLVDCGGRGCPPPRPSNLVGWYDCKHLKPDVSFFKKGFSIFCLFTEIENKEAFVNLVKEKKTSLNFNLTENFCDF